MSKSTDPVIVEPQQLPPPGDLPTFVYRFYDADGTLLYVGITLDPHTRWEDHRTGKPWWPDVASITAHRYPTRLDALIEEDRAIRDEGPLYNRANSRAAPKERKCPGRPEVGKPSNIRFEDDLRVRIKAEAERRGTSFAKTVRDLVEAQLDAIDT